MGAAAVEDGGEEHVQAGFARELEDGEGGVGGGGDGAGCVAFIPVGEGGWVG